MKAWIGTRRDDDRNTRATASDCGTQDIPLLFHPSHHGEFDTLSLDEFPNTRSTLNRSVTEDDLAAQQCHTRPIQKLDTFVWRIVARIMQISRMIQSPRRKVAVTVPDHKICIRADLDGTLLGIHAVQFRRILRCQFDKTLDVQTLAS
jgi:hypothetical protein